jgi:hypothetical protein
MEVGDKHHAPAALSSRKEPGIHWMRGCVDYRAGPDFVTKKILPYRGNEFRRLACSLFCVAKLNILTQRIWPLEGHVRLRYINF